MKFAPYSTQLNKLTAAIILAGGLGTRLRSVVPDLPKPMASVRGRPYLEYQMDYWIQQGVSRFTLSVGYMKEVIMNHFGANYKSTPITYAVEEEPLGTGGGLLIASRKQQNEPFLVLNGDTFFEVDLTKLLRFHEEQKSDWTFSLFRSNDLGRYMGVNLRDDGRIISFNSRIGKPSCLVNGGVYLINPSTLMQTKFRLGQKVSLEDNLLPDLIVQGAKIYGYESPGFFIDIGVPRDYLRASELLPQYIT